MNQKPADCPFCEYIAQNPAHDAENLVLLRGRWAYLILNRYPYNTGHLMALPNAHASTLAELDAATQAELMFLTTYATRLLEAVFHPQGFNVGINIGRVAGAGMAAHLHIHIVPRWAGDTNFMPVVAATRVLPEWLADTYQRLHTLAADMPFVMSDE